MDEILEDNQWINIQDPIKQMITSITKAIRTQSAGIRDLDRKIGFLASTESTHALVDSVFSKCFTKQDASLLVDTVNRKANIEDVSAIESNLMHVTRQLSKLNEVLQEQNAAVRELNNRVTLLQEEIEDARNPNYQQIFTYIDKQINKLVGEMNDRLSEKADVREVERAIPQKVDEVYRNLLSQMNGLHKDLGRTVTKDEFHQLLASKAESSEVRNLVSDVSNCVSKQELHSTLQHQLRPLISSIGSLEKVIQIQEDRRDNSVRTSQKTASSSTNWTYEKLQSVVEDYLVQKYPHLNETVTSLTLENALIQHREYLLNEITRQQNELRRETELNEREFLISIKRKYEEKFQDINGGLRETRDLTINNQSALKELSTSVAKMISKKVDRSDVSRLIHEYANGIVMDKSSTRETPGNRRSSKSPTFSDRHSSPSPTSIFQGHHTTSSTRSGGNSLKLKTPYRGNEQQEEYDSLEEEIVEQKSGKTKNLHQKQNKLLQSYTALQKDYQVLLEKVELCQQDINQFKEGMSQELSIMKRRYMENSANTSGSRSSRGDPAIIPPSSSMYTDWRIALGELSLNLRREMSEKCGREEMRSALGIELNLIEKKLHSLSEEITKKAAIEEMSQIENTVIDLRAKVAGELTGGRWLWTNGKIGKDGWIAWDTEVQNAAPGILLWRKGSTQITTRIPGLYRICGAVFTSLPSALQICLNGEPILSLQPDVSDPSTASNAQALREEKYIIRRMRHSVGEVTCLSIEEHVSLPADAQLTMRFHSSSPAQAFFSIKKL